jgi:phage terminase small subunit
MITKPKPPAHLRAETRKWFAAIVDDFDLESHHLKLLTLAAEAWDRVQQAREALDKHGLTFIDRYGSLRARPEAAIESQSRIAFARLLRELSLDVEPPPESRPPAMRGYRA